MKENISFFYNLNPKEVKEELNYYVFFINSDKYYLVPYKRPITDLEELFKLNEEIFKKRIPTHSMIINKQNKLLTKINDIEYILLKLNCYEHQKITLADILLLNSNFVLKNKKSNLFRNNWGDLWSKKIDYFEYQVRELAKDKEVILNSFSYYVGLAENAISYVNKTNIDLEIGQEDITSLSHHRIFYPNYAINYFNPLSYIFDLEVRDIAEYIKAKFFSDKNVWDEIEQYFNKRKLTPYSYRMFYSRLLFPSYYFDTYEEVIRKEKNEQELINIIEKVEEYEEFLMEMYIYLSKKCNMPKIDWLIKKE